MILLATTADGDATYLLLALGLLGVAVLLAVLELFVPTGGILAILTIAALLASVASMFVHDTTWGGVYIALLLAGAPFLVIYGVKLWSVTPIARRAILQGDASRGADASAPAPADLHRLVGSHGVTITALRPVGFVRIDGRRYDALAEDGLIEAEQSVVVVGELDGTLKVRPRPV